MTIRRKTALGLVALDMLAFTVTFNAIALFRGVVDSDGLILEPLFVPLVIFGVALYLVDGYKLHSDMRSLDYTSMHFIALISAMLATLMVTFVFIPGGYPLQQSRAVIALCFLLLIPLTITYRRMIYDKIIRERRERSIVFIGDHANGLSFRKECEKVGMKQPIIYATGGSTNTAPFLDKDPRLPFSVILEQQQRGDISIEAIVLRETNRDLSSEVSQQLVDLYFSGVPTYTLELFHQIYWRKIPLYRLNQTWLFQEGFEIAREPVFERLKRMSDIFLALIGLTVGLPIILVAALGVWFDDRGDVFFRQTRIGKNRKPFKLYKFRTMRPNTTTDDPYARPGDMRITKVGRLLRACRLDEFPQMINVLRGEMSLIGPRAEWDRLVLNYEKEIPCYHFRHLVRPGITGWAQVNYPYGANIEDTLRKLEYDLYYIRHFSFTLDASIVLKTIHVMLFGKGT